MNPIVKHAELFEKTATSLEDIRDPEEWTAALNEAIQECREIGGKYAENPEGIDDAAEILIRNLELYDLPVSGEAAITLGAMIECGMDTAAVAKALRSPFKNVLKLLLEFHRRVVEDIEIPEDGEYDPDILAEENGGLVFADRFISNEKLREYWAIDRRWGQAENAADSWYLPVVATLLRNRKAMLEWRGDSELMFLLSELRWAEMKFPHELLEMPIDEEFVVLHPTTCQGFTVIPEGVTHNFQLQVLLGDALNRYRFSGPKGGIKAKRPAKNHVLCMKNEDDSWADSQGEGIWNVYNWQAIDETGSLPDDVPSDLWVWNEGIPADISRFESTRIIVLGPPSYSRCWNAGPSFSPLPASIKVTKTFSNSETKEWLNKIGKAQSELRR